MSRIKQI